MIHKLEIAARDKGVGAGLRHGLLLGFLQSALPRQDALYVFPCCASIGGGKVMVNNANVVKTDIACGNEGARRGSFGIRRPELG